MKYIKEGYDQRIVRKVNMMLQIHIKHDGSVLFKSAHKGIRSLSLVNNAALLSHLSKDIIRKLLTLKPNQEWLEDLLKIDSVKSRHEASHIHIGNNLCSSASCLQDFVNNVNTRNHFISADWFNGIGIYDIVGIMRLRHDPTRYFKNANDYFDFVEQGDSDFDTERITLGVIKRKSNINNRIISPSMGVEVNF